MADKLTKEQEEQIKKEVEKQVNIEKRNIYKKLFDKTTTFGLEFKKQIITALIAAFGLVIALSWQIVIKKFIDNLIPKSGILIYHPYLTDLYAAIIITALSVISLMIISLWAKSSVNEKNKI